MHRRRHLLLWLLLLPLAAIGCASPYHADQDALLGGAVGAGTGAVIGHAVGNTGAGAVIGAGVGALTGSAIGSEDDANEARVRAAQAQQNSRAATAATIQDVVNMTHSNVEEGLIINFIQTRGVASPIQANELIYLQQQGVSRNVIAAMQAQPMAIYAAPPPGYIYYDRPRYYDPHVGVGFSFRSR